MGSVGMSEAFERNAVNADEIRGWALRNGFAEDADGLLTAFYKGASINISGLFHNYRLACLSGT